MTTLRVDTIYEGSRVALVVCWKGEEETPHNFSPLDPVYAEVSLYVDNEFEVNTQSTLPIREMKEALAVWKTWLRQHCYYKIVCCPYAADDHLTHRIKMFTKLGFEQHPDGYMVVAQQYISRLFTTHNGSITR